MSGMLGASRLPKRRCSWPRLRIASSRRLYFVSELRIDCVCEVIERIFMNTCPNCAAPINQYKVRCEYCGSYLFDFTALDLTSGKKVFAKFKLNNAPDDKDYIVTALAIPEMKTISMKREQSAICDTMENRIRCVQKRSVDIGVSFHCTENTEDGTLFKIKPLE